LTNRNLAKINRARIWHRCGHDGQRKGVAHMPTATTAAEDRNSKLVQKGAKITHSIA
jgi:hypothetical protein